jgi:hypothetical protein
MVGGICALLNNVLVVGFAWLGFNYVAATLLSFGPVLAIGYGLHTFFTFETVSSTSSFLRYVLAMTANYPAWFFSLYVLCDLAGAPVAVGAPTTTVLIFAWNYRSALWALKPTKTGTMTASGD